MTIPSIKPDLRKSLLGILIAATLPTVSFAGSVSSELSLPETREQGKGMPECGNPDDTTTADRVVSGIGSGIDKALEGYTGGLPIASAVFDNPEVSNWIKSRLGLNRGKSACGSVCVSYPGTSRGDWTVDAWDNVSSASLSSTGQEFGIGWAYLENVTHSTTGTNSVMCANVRHWKHDRERSFRLSVSFSEPSRESASSSSSERGWRICNKSDEDSVWLTYAYLDVDDDEWVSKGWREIEKGECTKVRSRLDNRYFYYYAEGDDGKWSGDTKFCAHPNEKFTVRGDDCPSGYKSYGYVKVDTGSSKKWTTNLVE